MQVEKDTGKILSSKYAYKHMMTAYSDSLGYIHQSGFGYTSDRSQAWVGNKGQFRELCKRFNHDRKKFKLFPLSWLTALLTDGSKGQHLSR